MKTNRAGRELIKSAESLRLKAYLCPAGVWTIGYGDTDNVRPGMIITEDEAEQRLSDRLAREFEPGVERLAQVPLSGNEFSALVSFAYNVGLNALAGSTLLRELNAGDYAGVSAEWGKWTKAGGKTLHGLVARREAERTLFETPGDGDE